MRAQLLTSPLWMRDHEPVPNFRLMEGWTPHGQATERRTTLAAAPSLVLNEEMQRLRISGPSEVAADDDMSQLNVTGLHITG